MTAEQQGAADAPPAATVDASDDEAREALEAQRLALRRIHVFVVSALGALGVVAVAVSLAGAGWGWTGITAHAHLWDWLHLLVLPIVLLLLPVWVRTHVRLGRQWRYAFAGLAVVFVVLVLGGYAWGWEWTGFSDNHLWDWLELLVLPVSVSLLPLWLGARRRFSRRQLAGAAAVGAVFGLVVLFGYVIPWGWTGFVGNTLLDWLQLFFVPFLIPATVTVLNHVTTQGGTRTTTR